MSPTVLNPSHLGGWEGKPTKNVQKPGGGKRKGRNDRGGEGERDPKCG